jgi:hypothetical protein
LIKENQMLGFLRLFLLCGLLFAVATSVAEAGSIKAVGGGWVGFPPDTSLKYAHFSFSAHTGPNGDFGQAGFSVSDEFGFPFDVKTDVDCVHVVAVPPFRGTTWFSGIVTRVNDPTGTYLISPGDRLYFSAYDGGDPSVRPVDDFEAWYFPPGGILPDETCKDIPPYVEPPNVTQGNIVIDLG